jgi:hypothetical protein
MRLHLHRPAPRTAAADKRDGEPLLAEMWLGSGHPLVRTLASAEIASRQVVTVTALQAAGVVWFLGDWSFGLSLAIGAGVAQAALVCRVAMLRTSTRDLCLELIADGGARLPLPCIERLCRDLLDRRSLERLASSIDELVWAAGHGAQPVLVRPLADRRVIRAVASDLRSVAPLLRGDPAVEGVALVEWLLTSPASPLYGSEVEPLRQHLGRARYLMTPD